MNERPILRYDTTQFVYRLRSLSDRLQVAVFVLGSCLPFRISFPLFGLYILVLALSGCTSFSLQFQVMFQLVNIYFNLIDMFAHSMTIFLFPPWAIVTESAAVLSPCNPRPTIQLYSEDPADLLQPLYSLTNAHATTYRSTSYLQSELIVYIGFLRRRVHLVLPPIGF